MLRRLTETFAHISKRIEKIDESLLDDRFPLEVIRTLKEKGPSVLQETVRLTQLALERGNLPQNDMDEILLKSDFMREMSYEFNKSSRYSEYRKLIGGHRM